MSVDCIPDGMLLRAGLEPVVTFRVVDADAEPTEYGSAEDPCRVISLADPEDDLAGLLGPDEVVAETPTIRVKYSYPFSTHGPTALEEQCGAWIFEEHAPNGVNFTRAGLIRAIAARYRKIYEEEEDSSPVAPSLIPGMLNRAPTEGRYGIWGHVLSDLALHSVVLDEATGLYCLGIDS
jgi:hypothetical protein